MNEETKRLKETRDIGGAISLNDVQSVERVPSRITFESDTTCEQQRFSFSTRDLNFLGVFALNNVESKKRFGASDDDNLQSKGQSLSQAFS